jgi:hypothetical protein
MSVKGNRVLGHEHNGAHMGLLKRCAPHGSQSRRKFGSLVMISCQNVTDDMPTKLTNEIIAAAIAGFEGQKRKIDTQIAELRAMLSGSPVDARADEPVKGPHRKRSSAARKRMAAAQRKRWAAVKGQTAAPAKKTSKPKRKLSAAGRAAIIAAMKKRWADKKATAKN